MHQITARNTPRHHAKDWQAVLLAMLPAIRKYASSAFRDLPPEAKQDAIIEVVANCTVAVARLAVRGMLDVAYPRPLAKFAIRQYRDGRRVGKRANVRDVYDQHGQIKNGHQLKYIGCPRDQRGGWREQLVENKRTSPADLVAFRLDFDAWLPSLPHRDRHIVEDLAMGERTSDVARKFGVSAGRVSQLRRQLQQRWDDFQADGRGPDRR